MLVQGGALQASDVEQITVADCNFTRNGPLPAGFDGTPVLTSTGAAVGVVNGKLSGAYPLRLVIRGSRFVDNHGDAGGGVSANQWSVDRARVEIHGCFFSGNRVSNWDECICSIVHGAVIRLLRMLSARHAAAGRPGGRRDICE